jgi:nucleoredoxin
MLSRFPGLKVLHGKNGDVPVSALDGKTVLVYFSAHWCPPCRSFTPQLASFYRSHAKEKNFEIVFASWDQSKAEFEEYFQEQPWLAFPYETSKQIIEQLGTKYQVRSIPTLLVFGADGTLITKEGRMSVVRDPQCQNFPWVGADATAASSSMNVKVIFAAVVLLYFVYNWWMTGGK